jgi:uncharacterized protein
MAQAMNRSAKRADAVRLDHVLIGLKLLIGLAALVLLGVFFDQLLDWAERFSRLSPVLKGSLAIAVGAALLTAAFFALKYWRRAARPTATIAPPATAEALAERIEAQQSRGVVVDQALAELATLRERHEVKTPYVAVFGAVSMGKSSVLNALANVGAAVDVCAGTTTTVQHYRATLAVSGEVSLADVPGFADAHDKARGALARDEALRADLVVYVADGDLGRAQGAELDALIGWGKPLLIALSKSDRYSEMERAQILERVSTRAPQADVLWVRSGGVETVIKIDANGRETPIERARKPDVLALREAIDARLRQDPTALRALRDQALLKLGSRKLDEAQGEWAERASALAIERATRNAVIGALAAVAPGTDLIIQGVLATKLLSELCEIHGVPAGEVEIRALLERIELRARLKWALALSIVGNGLKAFPGLGTVGGGLVHAVAYGLIFEALGNAVAESLRAHRALKTDDVVARLRFADAQALGARAVELAKLALSKESR